MAEGFAKSHLKEYLVSSGGTHPEKVNPYAIKVMSNIGIDISNHKSNLVNDYLTTGIEIAITVCDNANKNCPVFPGNVERLHWSINDPFKGGEFDESQVQSFRDTREEIKQKIIKFLEDQ